MDVDKELIDKVKQQVKIEDIVEKLGFVLTDRRSKNCKCICPFHDDHDPSLNIDVQKQTFCCYVCNTYGDVYTFVSRYLNLSFIDAYRKVVELANLPEEYLGIIKKTPVYTHYSENELKSHLLHERISEYLEYNLLLNVDNAKDYLINRHLDNSTIQISKFGYVNDLEKLETYLLRKYKYTREELLSYSDFFYINDYGKLASKFNKRISIPIFDKYNSLVGFGSRRLDDDKTKSKYINSAESDVFKKSNLLFNFFSARNEIYRSKEIYLVEGYMDAIMLVSKGVKNVVALMGKVLTSQQLEMLKNIQNLKVHIALDMDSAGRKAAINVAEELDKHKVDYDLVWFEKANDPGELCEVDMVDEMQNTIMLFEYVLKHEYIENNGIIDDEDLLNRLLLILNKEDSPIKRNQHLKLLANESLTEIEVLKEQLMYLNKAESLVSKTDDVKLENKQKDSFDSLFGNGRRISNV